MKMCIILNDISQLEVMVTFTWTSVFMVEVALQNLLLCIDHMA